MHQYELAYPNFRFFGPLPRDIFKFEMELPTAIHPNITQFYHEGNKPFDIGMIFNTDCSDQSGSHWTCAFIHVEPNASTVEYFDSVASSSLIRGSRGKCERDQIRRYLEKLTSQLKSIDPNVRFRENDIEHQFKDADCGVYCLNYIISRLEGKSFDQITQTVIRDNEMNILRDFFFRPRWVPTGRSHKPFDFKTMIKIRTSGSKRRGHGKHSTTHKKRHRTSRRTRRAQKQRR